MDTHLKNKKEFIKGYKKCCHNQKMILTMNGKNSF